MVHPKQQTNNTFSFETTKKVKKIPLSMTFDDIRHKETKKVWKKDNLFSFAGSSNNLHSKVLPSKESALEEINVKFAARVPDIIKPQFFFNVGAKAEGEVESDFSTPGFV